MQSGWRYRLVAICGATLLVAAAVVVANRPFVQLLVTAVPPLDNLRVMTFTNGELFDQLTMTVAVTLVVLWPLFKPRPRRVLDTVSLAHRRVFLTAAVLATIGYFDWSSRLPRTTLIATIGILAIVLPLWFVTIRRRPAASSRALMVGDDSDIMQTIYRSAEASILGVVAPPGVHREPARHHVTDGGVQMDGPDQLPRVGGLSRLDQVLVEHDIDTVLLAFEQPDREEFFGALASCFEHGVRAKVHRDHADSVLVADFAGDELVDTRLEPWDWLDYVVKRGFDIVFASVALLCLLPVIAVIAAVVKLDSPGPVLYSQTRTASFGDRFTIYKFRTMTTGEERTTPTGEDNDRITRSGRSLRRTHLDEIPQLWSILVGNMSVVGPRAAWTDEERHLEAETDRWRKRWFVKPGLTGLAQVNGMTSEHPREKLRYDIRYIRKQSFWFDLKIIVRQLYGVGIDLLALLRESDTNGRR